MHSKDHDDLIAAIVAHCEWLKSEHVTLPSTPDVLSAVELLSLMPERRAWCFPPGGFVRLQRHKHRLRKRKRPKSPWARARLRRRVAPAARRVPRSVADAVLTSLQALCALRTRATVVEIRKKTRERADERVKQAAPTDRSEVKRDAKLVKMVHEDSHLADLEPSLEQLQQRLRTATRSLGRYMEKQRKRHRVFVEAGVESMSEAGDHFAMARWVAARCDALHAEIDIFRAEAQGAVAAEGTGHKGTTDSKDWYRVRGKAKLWLKEAGAPSALGPTLFPNTRSKPSDPDPDAKRQQSDRESKERKRAKNR